MCGSKRQSSNAHSASTFGSTPIVSVPARCDPHFMGKNHGFVVTDLVSIQGALQDISTGLSAHHIFFVVLVASESGVGQPLKNKVHSQQKQSSGLSRSTIRTQAQARKSIH